MISTQVADGDGPRLGSLLVEEVQAHLRLVHTNPSLERHGALFAAVLLDLFSRAEPRSALDRAARHLGFDAAAAAAGEEAAAPADPFADAPTIRDGFGASADVAEALPAAVFLAHKYARASPAAALRASANAGGAANQRGALLGALLGAAHGLAKLRQDPDTRALLDGLKKRDAIDLDIGRFLDATLAPDGSPGWLRAHKTRRPPGHRFHGLDMDCLDPNSKVK